MISVKLPKALFKKIIEFSKTLFLYKKPLWSYPHFISPISKSSLDSFSIEFSKDDFCYWGCSNILIILECLPASLKTLILKKNYYVYFIDVNDAIIQKILNLPKLEKIELLDKVYNMENKDMCITEIKADLFKQTQYVLTPTSLYLINRY